MSDIDADELFRIARRLEGQADATRGRARTLAQATSELRWQSPAADMFRARADGAVAGLHRSAGNLDRAASALRRHAHVVQTMETALSIATLGIL